MSNIWNLGPYGTATCTDEGAQDGLVNTSDILHGIRHYWSIETTADLNGIGVVYVHDLLLVIHHWGYCQ